MLGLAGASVGTLEMFVVSSGRRQADRRVALQPQVPQRGAHSSVPVPLTAPQAGQGREGILTLPLLFPPAAYGRAPTWTGLGATGRSARGHGGTRRPWTRRAEPWAARPRPARAQAAPLLPRLTGEQSGELWGTPCCLYWFPWVFFFCLISVISNHHEMTIKGFLMKKEITFIGLVF